jgi:hypothetical protein
MALSAVRAAVVAERQNMTPRNSKYWRDRADQARKHAAQVRDIEAERNLLAVARIYDSLADREAKTEQASSNSVTNGGLPD